MAGNDFYNSEFTFISPINMSNKQARDFMNEIGKNPSHPNKRFVVKENKTGANVYYTK